MRKLVLAALVTGLAMPLAAFDAAAPAPRPTDADLNATNVTQYHLLPRARKMTLEASPQGFYPAGALRADIPGKAVLHCILRPDGRLHDCVVIAETPERQGFGAATLNVVQHLRVQTLSLDGRPVPEEMIEFPMNWQTHPD